MFCRACNYDLRGLDRLGRQECPECGQWFNANIPGSFLIKRSRRWFQVHWISWGIIVCTIFLPILLGAMRGFDHWSYYSWSDWWWGLIEYVFTTVGIAGILTIIVERRIRAKHFLITLHLPTMIVLSLTWGVIVLMNFFTVVVDAHGGRHFGLPESIYSIDRFGVGYISFFDLTINILVALAILIPIWIYCEIIIWLLKERRGWKFKICWIIGKE